MSIYYTATGAPDDGSRGQTGPIRDEFVLIQAAFAMLSPPGSTATSLAYKFSAQTSAADPGAGYVRLNNTAPASASAVYIDLVDVNGVTQTALIDAFDDSTSTVKGFIRIYAVGNSANGAIYSVASMTSPSGYRAITIAYVSGTASFAEGDDVYIEFARTGDKGDKGDAGINGDALKYEARTSNTKLTASDGGKLIDITSGTFSQTLNARSTFDVASATSTLVYRNSGSGIVTFTPDTVAPDTIDGNTTRKVYPGEAFLLVPLGTNGWSAVVLKSFDLTDTSAGTWQPEPGYSEFVLAADGSGAGGSGGGGGGSGRGINTSSGSGGAGGGGAGPGQSGQHAEIAVSANRLAAKITGAGRGTIAYAPGAGGAGGTAGTGGTGATSGSGGNNGAAGGFGAAGNASTIGTSGDHWFLSAAGGAIGSATGGNDPRGGGGTQGNNNNAGGTAGTASNASITAASGPDFSFLFKGPQEQNAGDAAAGVSQTSVAAGTAGGHGSSPARAFGSSTNDLTGLGAANALAGAGAATIVAGKPATPATPVQAPAGCGGYGGGGGGGSAGVGAGSSAATAAGGDAAPGGIGGPGRVRIRGVL